MVLILARVKSGNVVQMRFTNENNAKSYAKRLILRKAKILSISYV